MFSKDDILGISEAQKESHGKEKDVKEELTKLAEETLEKIEQIGDVEEFIDILKTLAKSLALVL